MGYCLTGENTEDVFFFLYGRGSTGKTTFIETMKEIFGDYAKSFPIEYLTANGKDITGDEPSPTLYNMRHCYLAISSETKKNRKFDVDKLKRWTGKDTLTVRTLHKPSVEFKPKFKILITGNFAPRVEDIYDSGLRRRLRIIPFKHKPEKVNTQLGEIFAKPENKSAIFNWVLEGLKMYRADKEKGINPFDENHLPNEVARELNIFYNRNDNIHTFLQDENYKAGYGKNTRVKDLFQNYLTWCKMNNERNLNRTDFAEHILMKFAKKKPKEDEIPVYYIPPGNGIRYAYFENLGKVS